MPGHRLGHRVLHLQPRVQLQEAPRAVAADEELDRAGAAVAGRRGDRDGGRAERGALVVVDRRGGRLLEDLLVAALQRAVALAQVDAGAVAVGQHLHLDMAGAGQAPLQVDAIVAERGGRLPPRRVDGRPDPADVVHRAHPAPAAARRGLHEQGRAQVDGLTGQRCVGQVVAGVAGRDRDAGGLGQAAGRDLVAQGAHRRRRRPHPAHAGRLDGLGQVGVLGQVAVAGVHGVGARVGCGRHDRGDAEVARDGRRGIGQLDVQRSPVGRLVHRVWGDAELPARADHAHRDLAAVCDQEAGDSGDHAGGRLPRNASSPSRASLPARVIARRSARSGSDTAAVASRTSCLEAAIASGPQAR